MSWAMRKLSRDRPSRKSPAIASRGAKPMECTKPSKPSGQAGFRPSARAAICSSEPTSQSKTSFEPNSAAVFGDALLEALALVAEGEFGAFAVAGACDAIGDRAVVQYARDEQAFAGEESHAVSVCC